jgi:ERCC4-related helicase
MYIFCILFLFLRRDIFIVTAQVLLNFLNSKDVGKLNMFDIIVFDECHHADKKHPYKKIMDNYFEQRLVNGETALPQVCKNCLKFFLSPLFFIFSFIMKNM